MESSSSGLHLTSTISHHSELHVNAQDSSPPAVNPNEQDPDPRDNERDGEIVMEEPGGAAASGEGGAETAMEEEVPIVPDEVQAKRETPMTSGTTPTPGGQLGMGTILGPRKTKITIRDAAWSTWWATLYWVSEVPDFLVSRS